MIKYETYLRLVLRRRASLLRLLAVITVTLVIASGFGNVLHAQDALVPMLSESVLEAGQIGSLPRVSDLPVAPTTSNINTSAGLVIIPTFDSSIDAATQSAINTAIAFYQNNISTPITVNIHFRNMGSGLGSSLVFFFNQPYSTWRSGWAATASSSDDAAALASTPAGATNPIDGSSFIGVKSPNGRAVGLNTPEQDFTFGGSPCPGFVGSGCIGINVALANSFGVLITVLQHEIDEVLGMGSILRGTTPPTNPPWTNDLFRWASPGVRSFAANPSSTNPCSGATPRAFFSIDGGVTNLNEYNNCGNGGDYGDWITHTPSQVQDAFTNFSGAPTVTLGSAEARLLDVLGYTFSSSTGLRFVAVAPCRVADTRNPNGPFGGPIIAGGTSRSFTVPSSSCGIPSTALAYSFNVTVVPPGPLGFLTIWPTGQAQPGVSTLNSLDGRIKANAAIVVAGTSGAVSVFVSNTSHVILDINGYFTTPASAPSGLVFYPVTPCRIMDTRGPVGPLGGPILGAGSTRTVPVLSSTCGIPGTAAAYSLNMTVVPTTALGFLTTWPTGIAQPLVSTLNDPTGTIVANAAIVPSGTGGSINVFVSDQTDLIIDVNGYFAPPAAGGLLFYAVSPCRVVDTRNPPGPFGGPALNGQRDFNVLAGPCSVPGSTKAYSFNATVVPSGSLGFLTLWPAGQLQPLVSTLNSPDASIVSNAAIVPTNTGAISAFSTNTTHLILDINGAFAP
jgi:hypothetical protein